ncbi:hypothetical protein ACFST9_00180 [Hymenobacter monticola]|uniref:Uncharacterized protein n=1 Tax=Hymenobacter monticola TaxID=1705399 RepID=A0ABY4BFR3_9BACT|nr:hypothetical protein [Hymenobacter monticola]UOE36821.1 hypothetical protein MTP16_25425 [Hymenobacter monticola]
MTKRYRDSKHYGFVDSQIYKWFLLLCVVLFVGCRAERAAFSFQPVNSGTRENVVILTEAPSTGEAGVGRPEPSAAKRSVRIEPLQSHKASKAVVRKTLFSKNAAANARKTNYLQSKIPTAYRLKPTVQDVVSEQDGVLRIITIAIGIACLALFIIGLLTHSLVLAILFGIPLLGFTYVAVFSWLGQKRQDKQRAREVERHDRQRAGG